jgi:hypothetical protein
MSLLIEIRGNHGMSLLSEFLPTLSLSPPPPPGLPQEPQAYSASTGFQHLHSCHSALKGGEDTTRVVYRSRLMEYTPRVLEDTTRAVIYTARVLNSQQKW